MWSVKLLACESLINSISSQSNKEYFFISFEMCKLQTGPFGAYLPLQGSIEKAGAARTCLLLIKYLKTSNDYSLETKIALSMTNQAVPMHRIYHMQHFTLPQK